MGMDTIIKIILGQGVVGAVAVLAFWFALRKDKEVREERDARLADQKEYTKLFYDLQNDSNEALEAAVNLCVRQAALVSAPKLSLPTEGDRSKE